MATMGVEQQWRDGNDDRENNMTGETEETSGHILEA